MRILENTYKIGQKVLVQDYDTPMRYDPAFIVGIDRSEDGRSLTYTVSYSKCGNKYLSDGCPEDIITTPNSLYYDDELWENL
jgi:hypothetical protein